MPSLIYCYDAYCGWCYGFSPVMKKIAEVFGNRMPVEVLSGGMIIAENPLPISASAAYIQQAYPIVEARTGIRFGEDFLWHIFHPDQSDWFPSSQKPAMAMCIFKEYHPLLQVQFAADLQYALKYEGRDLCDDEAYRHLLLKYHIPAEDFYSKLHSDPYREKSRYEFALVKQLQVTGFPALLLQANASRFYLLARGYTDYQTLETRINHVWNEISAAAQS